MEYRVYNLTDVQVERINSELLRFDDKLMQMYMLTQGKTYKFLDYTRAYLLIPIVRKKDEACHIVYYSDYAGNFPIETVTTRVYDEVANVEMWTGSAWLAMYHDEVSNGKAKPVSQNDYEKIVSLIRQAADRRRRDAAGLF